MNYRHKKHFTVAEAIQSLYQHYALIEKMQKLSQHLMEAGNDLDDKSPNLAGSDKEDLLQEFGQLMEVITKIEAEGILIADFKQGIVDFPHIRSNGEEVYLCFKLGEDFLSYWHTLNGGFANRQSLDQL